MASVATDIARLEPTEGSRPLLAEPSATDEEMTAS